MLTNLSMSLGCQFGDVIGVRPNNTQPDIMQSEFKNYTFRHFAGDCRGTLTMLTHLARCLITLLLYIIIMDCEFPT